MQDNQKINCTVDTCEYNDTDDGECTLKAIDVSPVPDSDTHTPDDSKCGSFKYDDEEGEE